MLLILKILLCAIAAVIFVLAAFRSEPDEAKLQNALQSTFEGWWVRLDDRRIKTEITETRFLAYFASFMGRVLDILFGHKLLSWKAVSVSVAISTCVYLLYVLVAKCTFWVGSPQPSAYVDGTLLPLVVVVWYRSQHSSYNRTLNQNRPWVFMFCVCLVSLFTEELSALYIEGHVSPNVSILKNVAIELLPALLLSSITDFATIVSFRALLRRLTVAQSWLKLFGFSVLIALVSCSVVALPFLAGLAPLWFAEDRPEFDHTVSEIVGMFFTLVWYNVGDFLLFFGTAMFVGCLILNRTLWQTVNPPVYALQRVKFYEHRRILFAVAFALLGMALVPIKDSWVKAILDVAKHFFGL